jgi:hypothetical protein
MNILGKTLSLAITFVAIIVSGAAAADLTKAEAKAIMEFTGCANAVVGVVVNGSGPMLAGPNVALVSSACTRNGKRTAEDNVFVRDVDLGWIFYQIDPSAGRVRLWTTRGYQEAK